MRVDGIAAIVRGQRGKRDVDQFAVRSKKQPCATRGGRGLVENEIAQDARGAKIVAAHQGNARDTDEPVDVLNVAEVNQLHLVWGAGGQHERDIARRQRARLAAGIGSEIEHAEARVLDECRSRRQGLGDRGAVHRLRCTSQFFLQLSDALLPAGQQALMRRQPLLAGAIQHFGGNLTVEDGEFARGSVR